MKKIFLIIFIMVPIYAGRIDPQSTMHDYAARLLKIRTQLGHDLPPDEKDEHEEPSFEEKVKLYREFWQIFDEFTFNKEIFKNHFVEDTQEKRSFYTNFVAKIAYDRNKYAPLLANQEI
jgi:hypothetical protein